MPRLTALRVKLTTGMQDILSGHSFRGVGDDERAPMQFQIRFRIMEREIVFILFTQ